MKRMIFRMNGVHFAPHWRALGFQGLDIKDETKRQCFSCRTGKQMVEAGFLNTFSLSHTCTCVWTSNPLSQASDVSTHCRFLMHLCTAVSVQNIVTMFIILISEGNIKSNVILENNEKNVCCIPVTLETLEVVQPKCHSLNIILRSQQP